MNTANIKTERARKMAERKAEKAAHVARPPLPDPDKP